MLDFFKGEETCKYFGQLWTSDKLDEDDRNMIWQWMDLFVTLSEKYIKKE